MFRGLDAGAAEIAAKVGEENSANKTKVIRETLIRKRLSEKLNDRIIKI